MFIKVKSDGTRLVLNATEIRKLEGASDLCRAIQTHFPDLREDALGALNHLSRLIVSQKVAPNSVQLQEEE